MGGVMQGRSVFAASACGCIVAVTAASVALLGGVGQRSAVAQSPTPAAERPNVVVVMSDDQDLRSVTVMRLVKQRLGEAGTTFRNHYASFPLCCPSRATFLTGQYAHNHGVRSNLPPRGGFRAFNDRRTLPVSLQRAGYRTGFVGKYLNGYGRKGRGNSPRYVPRGWSRWFALITMGYYGYRVNDNRRLRSYGARRRDYQTDVLARRASRFVRTSAGGRRPFFLLLSTHAPHGDVSRVADPLAAPRHRRAFRHAPFPRPPSFNEADASDKPAFIRGTPRLDGPTKRKLTRRYRARLRALLAVDDAVGRLVRALRKSGELENTLVVFTSDNGWLQGEHRLIGKVHLYEESAKVPLIMRGPGVPRGETTSQLTANIDLAPTILDVAGARPARVMDGAPLLPFDPAGAAGDRAILLDNRGVRGPRSRAVRTDRWVYAWHGRGRARELYDLASDPFQLSSLHRDAQHAEVKARLAATLSRLSGCSGQTCRQ